MAARESALGPKLQGTSRLFPKSKIGELQLPASCQHPNPSPACLCQLICDSFLTSKLWHLQWQAAPPTPWPSLRQVRCKDLLSRPRPWPQPALLSGLALLPSPATPKTRQPFLELEPPCHRFPPQKRQERDRTRLQITQCWWPRRRWLQTIWAAFNFSTCNVGKHCSPLLLGQLESCIQKGFGVSTDVVEVNVNLPDGCHLIQRQTKEVDQVHVSGVRLRPRPGNLDHFGLVQRRNILSIHDIRFECGKGLPIPCWLQNFGTYNTHK